MKDTLFITMGHDDNEINAQFDVDEPNAIEKNIIARSVVDMMGATSEMYYGDDWRFVVEFVESGLGIQVLCKGDYPNVHVEEHDIGISLLYEDDMGYYYASDMLKEWVFGRMGEK